MEIRNISKANYNCDLPDGRSFLGEAESNIVETNILTYQYTKEKTTDKNFLLEGETANQKVVLTNNSNITLYNQFFKDSMSRGISFVAGTVKINGVSEELADITTGFNLADIAPNETITIEYQICADNPRTETCATNKATIRYDGDGQSVEEDTNIVEFDLGVASMEIVKTVNKEYAIAGDTLHYTSEIINTGTIKQNEIMFVDKLPNGVLFVSDSVTIDGTLLPGLNPNIGFQLPEIDVGKSVKVVFDVIVQ